MWRAEVGTSAEGFTLKSLKVDPLKVDLVKSRSRGIAHNLSLKVDLAKSRCVKVDLAESRSRYRVDNLSLKVDLVKSRFARSRSR